jgi:hypothetical protein
MRLTDRLRSARVRWWLALAVALVPLMLPSPAHADWNLAPFAGLKFKGDTTLLDVEDAADKRKFVYGGTVTWLGRGIFGVEGDVAFVQGYFNGKPVDNNQLIESSRLTTLMGNAVLAAPLSWTGDSLRPYLSGGFGLVRVRVTDNLGLVSTRNLGGFNLGGGAMGFITKRTGVKWDLRYVRGSGSSDTGIAFGSPRIHFWRATMALVIRY